MVLVKKDKKAFPHSRYRIIGWREWVSLPGLNIPRFIAKFDTGAKSAALHAVDIETYCHEGEQWVRFRVLIKGVDPIDCQAPLHHLRRIKNTSGIVEVRPTIVTKVAMGQDVWPIEVTLTDRAEMICPMILGRVSLHKRRLLVNPSRSFLYEPKD